MFFRVFADLACPPPRKSPGLVDTSRICVVIHGPSTLFADQFRTSEVKAIRLVQALVHGPTLQKCGMIYNTWFLRPCSSQMTHTFGLLRFCLRLLNTPSAANARINCNGHGHSMRDCAEFSIIPSKLINLNYRTTSKRITEHPIVFLVNNLPLKAT